MKYIFILIFSVFVFINSQPVSAKQLNIDCKFIKEKIVYGNNWPATLDEKILGVPFKEWNDDYSRQLAIGYSLCAEDAIKESYNWSKDRTKSSWEKGKKNLDEYIAQLPEKKKQIIATEEKNTSAYEQLSAKINSLPINYEGKKIFEDTYGCYGCVSCGWLRSSSVNVAKNLEEKHCIFIQDQVITKRELYKEFTKEQCDELMDDMDIAKEEERYYFLSSGREQTVRSLLCHFLDQGYEVSFDQDWINFGNPGATLEIEDSDGNELSVRLEQKDMLIGNSMLTVWQPMLVENSDDKSYEIKDAMDTNLFYLISNFFEQKQEMKKKG